VATIETEQGPELLPLGKYFKDQLKHFPSVFWLVFFALFLGITIVFMVGLEVLGMSEHDLPGLLVRDIGIAIIVSGVLAITFDFSFRRLTEYDTAREIYKGVSRFREESEVILLKRRMGEQVYVEFARHLDRPTLRKEHSLRLEITKKTSDQVIVLCRSKYVLANMRDGDTPYDVVAFGEARPLQDDIHITSVDIRPPLATDAFNCKGSDLAKYVITSKTGTAFSHPIRLPPNTEAIVEVEYSSIEAVPWQFPWELPSPQVGINLEVVHPVELVVHVWPSHPIRDGLEYNGSSVDGEVQTDKWSSKQVFLPYQGLQISWIHAPASMPVV
jgi:hypothetical protein